MNEEYPALTVDDLWKACVEQRKMGNGKKKILIAADDEGNEYHGLFYRFTDTENEIKLLKRWGCFRDDVPAEDVIILG